MRKLVVGLLSVALLLSSVGRPVHAGPGDQCATTFDATCLGRWPPPTDGFDFTNPIFQEVKRRYPDFATIPDDFLPGTPRMSIPASLTRQVFRFGCDDDEPLSQLSISCPPGAMGTVNLFIFGAGKPVIKSVPFSTPPPGSERESSWKRLLRKAKEYWVAIGAATVASVVTYVYFECVAGDEDTTCRQRINQTIHDDPIPSKVKGFFISNVETNRVTHRAAQIAATGGTAIMVRPDDKTAWIYSPGTVREDGTFEVVRNKIEGDAAPYYNAPQGRIYVPLRFMAQAIGVQVLSEECDTAGKCQLMPTLKNGATVVKFPVDADYFVLNGQKLTMGTGQTYIDPSTNRTMVPVRFALESFGYKAMFYPEANEALIYKGGALDEGD